MADARDHATGVTAGAASSAGSGWAAPGGGLAAAGQRVRLEPGAARTGSRDGLGLGLSIVAAIAAAHGAWLQANALPGGGLGVQVGFPQAAWPPPGAAQPDPAELAAPAVTPVA